MTKSEADAANDLVTTLAAEIKERLLPEKGAEFDIEYFAGEVPVKYGEEPYTWVRATSEGLRVVCDGPEFRISHSRQRKPILPAMFAGEDGAYRRTLRIAVKGNAVGNEAELYIHILGGLIVVSKEKLNCALMVGDESLTPKDRQTLDELRKKERE